MKNLLLAGAILAALLSSGCTGETGIEEKVKELPEVQKFLNENPGAGIETVYLEKKVVQSSIEYLKKQCGTGFKEEDYWYASVSKGEKKLEVYFNEDGTKAECVAEPLKEEDNRKPPSTECVSGDNYCPPGCHAGTDADCEGKNCSELRGKVCELGCRTETFEAADTDECCLGGCEREKTCRELGGKECKTGETCTGKLIDAPDTEKCCEGECKKTQDLAVQGKITLGGEENKCAGNKLHVTISSPSASSLEAEYEVKADGSTIKTGSLTVYPGTRSYAVNAGSLQALNKKITVTLDPENKIESDADKTNNSVEEQFAFEAKDYYVKSLEYTSAFGGIISYEIEVDESTADCALAETNLYINGALFTGPKNCSMNAGEDVVQSCTAETPVEGGSTLKVEVDPNNKIMETNEANNEYIKNTEA